MLKISPRVLLAGIAVFCFGLLAFGWFLQYGPGKQQPCPLCVLQRYTYIFVGLTALAGVVHTRIGYALAAALFAVCGVGLATWHTLKGASMTGCQRDPIGIFVNGLPTADWFPEYFFATGGCADAYFFMGIGIQIWSLICFSVLIGACLYIAWRLRRSPAT